MKIDSIECYLLTLGKLATIVQMLDDEQKIAIRTGILTNDEMELSETISWNCKKLITSLGDQVSRVGERTAKPWDETLEDLKKELNK